MLAIILQSRIKTKKRQWQRAKVFSFVNITIIATIIIFYFNVEACKEIFVDKVEENNLHYKNENCFRSQVPVFVLGTINERINRFFL